MSQEEEKYKEDLKKAGVDVPDLDEKPANNDAPEDGEEEKKDEKDKDENPESDDEKDEEEVKDNPPKKRSIYDDLKEKKQNLREEKERSTKLEQENTELKKQLNELNEKLSDPNLSKKDKDEAIDDFEEFAKEIDADPKTIKKMFDLFSAKTSDKSLPDNLKESLEEFQNWKKENSVLEEGKKFQQELSDFQPSIKQSFPNASDVELKKISTELDRIAHSEGWNDKSLKYILFEHQDHFAKNFVSPKKRGMEGADKRGKDDKDGSETPDFNPNADLSSMSPAERKVWEEQYRKMTARPTGLLEDGQGRKIII